MECKQVAQTKNKKKKPTFRELSSRGNRRACEKNGRSIREKVHGNRPHFARNPRLKKIT